MTLSIKKTPGPQLAGTVELYANCMLFSSKGFPRAKAGQDDPLNSAIPAIVDFALDIKGHMVIGLEEIRSQTGVDIHPVFRRKEDQVLQITPGPFLHQGM